LSQRAINDKKSPGELGSVMREEMIEFYGHNAAITCVATFDSRLLLGTNIFRLFVEKNEEARAEARRARIHAARKNSQGEVPPSPKSISGSVSHARRQSFSTGEVRSMMKGGGLAAHGLKSAQCSPALEEMGMVVWEGDEPNGKGRKFRDEGFLDSVGRATQRDGGAADMANGADLYSRGRGRRLVHRFRHWAISGSEDRTLRVWYIPVHWEDKVHSYTPPPYTPPFLSIGRTRYTPTLLPHTLLHSCPLGGQGTTLHSSPIHSSIPVHWEDKVQHAAVRSNAILAIYTLLLLLRFERCVYAPHRRCTLKGSSSSVVACRRRGRAWCAASRPSRSGSGRGESAAARYFLV
jgi:hypothetical protein